jgi:phage terminase Nu1 subunit (DNA packaging protein)
MVDRLTVSQWAKTVGISKQAGYKAVERCQIPLVEGTLDPDVATTLYRKRTRARQNERTPDADGAMRDGKSDGGQDSGGGDYWNHRARREAAEAELAELKLAEQRGELVRAADVRAAHSKRAAGLREALLQIPARLAAVLAAESSQARVHDVLQRELHEVLSQVAN